MRQIIADNTGNNDATMDVSLKFAEEYPHALVLDKAKVKRQGKNESKSGISLDSFEKTNPITDDRVFEYFGM